MKEKYVYWSRIIFIKERASCNPELSLSLLSRERDRERERGVPNGLFDGNLNVGSEWYLPINILKKMYTGSTCVYSVY